MAEDFDFGVYLANRSKSDKVTSVYEASQEKIANLRQMRAENIANAEASRQRNSSSVLGSLQDITGADEDGVLAHDGLIGMPINAAVALGSGFSKLAGYVGSSIYDIDAMIQNTDVPQEVKDARARMLANQATPADTELLALPAGDIAKRVMPTEKTLLSHKVRDDFKTNLQQISNMETAVSRSGFMRNLFDLSGAVHTGNKDDLTQEIRQGAAENIDTFSQGIDQLKAGKWSGLGDVALGFGGAVSKIPGAALSNPLGAADFLMENGAQLLASGAGKVPQILANVGYGLDAFGQGVVDHVKKHGGNMPTNEDLAWKAALAGTAVAAEYAGDKLSGVTDMFKGVPKVIGDDSKTVFKNALLNATVNNPITRTGLAAVQGGMGEYMTEGYQTWAENAIKMEDTSLADAHEGGAIGAIIGGGTGVGAHLGKELTGTTDDKLEKLAEWRKQATDFAELARTNNTAGLQDPESKTYDPVKEVAVMYEHNKLDTTTPEAKAANLVRAREVVQTLEEKHRNNLNLLDTLSSPTELKLAKEELLTKKAELAALDQTDPTNAPVIAGLTKQITFREQVVALEGDRVGLKRLTSEVKRGQDQLATTKDLQESLADNNRTKVTAADVTSHVVKANRASSRDNMPDFEESQQSVQALINVSMTSSALAPSQALELANNKYNTLTPEQRSYFRQFSEARIAENKLMTLEKVSKAVYTGEGKDIGIAGYRRTLGQSFEIKDQRGADRTIDDLINFANDHAQKAALAKKAFAEVNVMGDRQILKTKANGWEVKPQGKPLTKEEVTHNGGFTVHKNSDSKGFITGLQAEAAAVIAVAKEQATAYKLTFGVEPASKLTVTSTPAVTPTDEVTTITPGNTPTTPTVVPVAQTPATPASVAPVIIPTPEIPSVTKTPEEIQAAAQGQPASNPSVGATGTATTVVTPATSLKGYVNHSGGAKGADTVWGSEGAKLGATSNHYRSGLMQAVAGSVTISPQDLEEGKVEAAKAAKRNWGYAYPKMKMDELIRNWAQVKYSDAVFAVSNIVGKGERVFPDQAKDDRLAIAPSVTGGTGYAVGMAINHNKPVYVFNQKASPSYPIGWYTWDTKADNFVATNTPVLTKNFAGIGSRNLTPAGIAAIQKAYKNTANQPAAQAQQAQVASKDVASEATEAFKVFGLEVATLVEGTDATHAWEAPNRAWLVEYLPKTEEQDAAWELWDMRDPTFADENGDFDGKLFTTWQEVVQFLKTPANPNDTGPLPWETDEEYAERTKKTVSVAKQAEVVARLSLIEVLDKIKTGISSIAAKAFAPNKEQAEGIKKIKSFLNTPIQYDKDGKPTNNIFVLEGKAGTGKTSLVQEAVADLLAKGEKITISAISHKAKSVLEDKLTAFVKTKSLKGSVEASSVAGLLGMKMDQETGKFSPDPFSEALIDGVTTLIVDEASMVNKEALKLILEKTKDKRVIFIGDRNQIEPIEENSKAGSISQVFTMDIGSNKHSLVTRVRQGEDSTILPYADFYWNNAENNQKLLDPIPNDKRQDTNELVMLPEQNWVDTVIPLFQKAFRDKAYNLVKVVAFNNMLKNTDGAKMLREAEDKIRRAIFGKDLKEFNKGELLVMGNNFSVGKDKLLENSSELIVLGSSDVHITKLLDPTGKQIPLKSYDIRVEDILSRERYTIQVLSAESRQAHEALLASWTDTALKSSGVMRKNAWSQFYTIKDRTFAPALYSYILTAHKAQGSTYDVTVIHEDNILSSPGNNAKKSRIMYTAITRASKLAVIVSKKNEQQQQTKKVEPTQEQQEQDIPPWEDDGVNAAEKANEMPPELLWPDVEISNDTQQGYSPDWENDSVEPKTLVDFLSDDYSDNGLDANGKPLPKTTFRVMSAKEQAITTEVLTELQSFYPAETEHFSYVVQDGYAAAGTIYTAWKAIAIKANAFGKGKAWVKRILAHELAHGRDYMTGERSDVAKAYQKEGDYFKEALAALKGNPTEMTEWFEYIFQPKEGEAVNVQHELYAQFHTMYLVNQELMQANLPGIFNDFAKIYPINNKRMDASVSGGNTGGSTGVGEESTPQVNQGKSEADPQPSLQGSNGTTEQATTEDKPAGGLDALVGDAKAEQAKTDYRERNLLKAYFSQSVAGLTAASQRPLVMVKNFISSLGKTTNFSDFLKDYKATEKQDTALNAFATLASKDSKWTKNIQQLLIQGYFTQTGKYRDNKDFTFDNPFTWMINKSTNGEFGIDENTNTAIIYAAVTAILELADTPAHNDKEAINKILGRDKEATVPDEAVDLLSDVGTLRNLVAASTGKTGITALGMKVSDEAGQNVMPQLEGGMGGLVIALLDSLGLLESMEELIDPDTKEKIKTQAISANDMNEVITITNELDGKNGDRADNFASHDELRVFVKLKRDPETGEFTEEVKAILEALRGSGNVLDKLMSVEAGLKYPSFTPVENTQTTTKTGQEVPGLLNETNDQNRSQANYTRKDMWKLLQAVSSIVGGLAGVEEISDTKTQQTKHKSIKAKNDGLWRELNRYYDYVKDILLQSEQGIDQPIYLDYSVWLQQRVGIDGNVINPQTSKAHRALFYRDSWESEVELANLDMMNNFFMRVGEGFGVKTERDTVEASLEKIQDKLADPIVQQAIKDLQVVLYTKIDITEKEEATLSEEAQDKLYEDRLKKLLTKKQQQNLLAANKLGGENFHTLDALVAMAHYYQALDTGSGSFITHIQAEVDGVANGPILAHAMFGAAIGVIEGTETQDESNARALQTTLNRGGFYTGEGDIDGFNVWKSNPHNHDLYEHTITKLIDAIAKSVAKTQEKFKGKKNKDINALYFFTGSLTKEDGNVSSDGRNFVKPPVTKMVFGEGVNKSLNSLAESFIGKVYDVLEKAANGDPKYPADKAIAAYNQLIGNNGDKLTLQNLKTFNTKFKLDSREKDALKKQFGYVFNEPLGEVIEDNFTAFLASRDNFTALAELTHGLYATVYETLRQQMVDRLIADEIAKPGTGIASTYKNVKVPTPEGQPQAYFKDVIAYRDLSKKEERQLEKQLAKMFPVIQTMFSLESNQPKAGLRIGKFKKRVSGKRAYQTKAHFRIGKQDSKSMTLRNMETAHEKPGVAMLPLVVHSSDSYISHSTQLGMELLNIHDAVISGLMTIHEAAEKMNQQTFHLLMNYSPMLQMYYALENTINGLDQVLAEMAPTKEDLASTEFTSVINAVDTFLNQFASDKKLEGNNVLLDMLTKAKNLAAAADTIKLNTLAGVNYVSQYAKENASYEVTEQDKAKIAEKLAEINTDIDSKTLRSVSSIFEQLPGKDQVVQRVVNKVTQQENTPSVFDVQGEDIFTVLGAVMSSLDATMLETKLAEGVFKHANKNNGKSSGTLATWIKASLKEKDANMLSDFIKSIFTEKKVTQRDNMPDLSESINTFSTHDIYNALPKAPVSQAFESHLSDVLTNIVEKLHGAFGSFKASLMENTAKSAIDTYAEALATGQAPYAFSLGSAWFVYSDKQAYVADQVHATILKALESNSGQNAAVYSELGKLFRETRSRLEPKDFYEGDWTTALPHEVAQATALYNRVFNEMPTETEARSNYLAEFAALGLTHEGFNKLLQVPTKLAPPVMQDKTIAGMLGRLFNKVLEFFNGKITHTTPGQNADVKLKALVMRLVELENTRVRMINKEQGGFMKFVDKQAMNIRLGKKSVVSKLMHSNMFMKNKNVFIAATSGAIATLADSQVGTFFRVIDSIRQEHFSGKQGVITGFLSEMNGPKPTIQALLRTIKHFEGQRKKIITMTNKFMLQSFDNQGKDMKDDDKKAVTAVLLHTGAHTLLDSGFDTVKIESLLKDETLMNKEIISFENQLNQYTPAQKAYFIEQSRALGFYLVTGKVTHELMLKNANNIANMYLSGLEGSLSKAEVEAATKTVDALTSLYAMSYTSTANKASMVKTMAQEHARTDGGNGVRLVLLSHKEMEQQSKERLFGGSSTLMAKGYVPEIYNPHTDIKAANAKEGRMLEDLGYVKGAMVGNDPSDAGAEAKHLYIMRDGGALPWLSGIFSFTGMRSKGTKHHGKNAHQMQQSITQEKQAAIHTRSTKQSGANFDPRKVKENHMAPLLNDNGVAVNYQYLMQSNTKELLERDTRFDTVLGALNGSIYDKENSAVHNRNSVQVMHDEWNKSYASEPKAYLRVSASSKDPEAREIYQMLPQATKDAIREIWGKDEMMVRANNMDIAFGYRKLSLSNAFDKAEEDRDFMEKTFVWWTENLLKVHGMARKGMTSDEAERYSKRAALYVRRSENVWQALVKEVKDIIVVKTGTVALANIYSNFLLLKLYGVPTVAMLRDMQIAWVGAEKYSKDTERLFELETNVASKAITTTYDVRQEIKELKDAIARNPVRNLIEAGLMPTIVEDVSAEEDIYSYKTRFVRKTEKYTDKLNKHVKAAGKQVLMTHDTGTYKAMAHITQLSDFVARYALYQHLKTQKEVVLTEKVIIQEVSDAFINYDVPMHRDLQYLDDMGITPFLKYFMRIQRVIRGRFKHAPGKVALLLIAQSYLDFPSPLDNSILFTFGNNPMSIGALQLPGLIPEIATINAGLSLFK